MTNGTENLTLQYRTLAEYVKLLAELCTVAQRLNMRPFDWVVIGRIGAQLGVRGVESHYTLPETVDASLKVGTAIGDRVFSVLAKTAVEVPERKVSTPLTPFEKDIVAALEDVRDRTTEEAKKELEHTRPVLTALKARKVH